MTSLEAAVLQDLEEARRLIAQAGEEADVALVDWERNLAQLAAKHGLAA